MSAQDAASPSLAEIDAYFGEELEPKGAAFARRWLAACAAYPLLRWPITTALGEALARADGVDAPDERLHLVLGRLPWFREGRMPAAARMALLARQSGRDRRTARDALTDILTEALDQGIGSQGRGQGSRGARARALARVIEALPPDAPQADALLPAVLRGRRPSAAGVAAARWNADLPPRLRPWLTPMRLAWAAGIVALVIAAVLAAPFLEQRLSTPRPEGAKQPVDIVRIALSACQADPGAGGKVAIVGPQGPLLGDSVILTPTASRTGGFARMGLDPGLTVAVTQEDGGPTRLWGLAPKGGVVELKGFEGKVTRVGVLEGSIAVITSNDARVTQLWNLDGTLRLSSSGGSDAAAPALGTALRYTTASGVKMIAVRRPDAAYILPEPDNGRPMAKIAWGAPLAALARSRVGRLVLVTCDPNGVLKPTGGMVIVPGPPRVYAAPSVRGMRLVGTYTVYFPNPGEEMPAAGHAVIARAAAAARKAGRVIVEAHTDGDPSDPDTLRVSGTYANAVSEALVQYGVKSSIISSFTYGATRPAVATTGKEPRNRRTQVFVFEPMAQTPPPPPPQPRATVVVSFVGVPNVDIVVTLRATQGPPDGSVVIPEYKVRLNAKGNGDVRLPPGRYVARSPFGSSPFEAELGAVQVIPVFPPTPRRTERSFVGYFARGSADVTPAMQEVYGEAASAAYAGTEPQLKVVVYASADDCPKPTGSEQAGPTCNVEELAQRRAQALRDVFQKLPNTGSMPAPQITTQIVRASGGEGVSEPTGRRVEITASWIPRPSGA